MLQYVDWVPYFEDLRKIWNEFVLKATIKYPNVILLAANGSLCFDFRLPRIQYYSKKKSYYYKDVDTCETCTCEELLNYCEKGQMLFSFNPKYIFNLFRSSIEKNDFSLLQMYISIYLSFLKEHINPFMFHNKKDA